MCWRKLAILTSAILLGACGGGGSDLSGGDDGGGTVPSSAPTLTPTPEPQPYALTVQLLDCNDVEGGWDRTKRDPSECVATTNVTSAKPAILYVTVADASGVNVTEHVVSAEPSIGEVKPDAKTALTDENGVAILDLQAGATSGAGTVVISTANQGVISSITKGYQITAGDSGTDAPISLSLKLLNCPSDWDRDVLDASLCDETTKVSTSTPAILHVSASRGSEPVANTQFSADTTLGELLPASKTALTNENGFGILDLNAGNSDGAGRVTVSLKEKNDGDTTTASLDYAIAIDGITTEQNVNVNLTILSCPENWDRKLRDATLCTETTDVSTGKPVVLYIKLQQGLVPLASQVVSAEATLGVIKPEQSKTALTDGNGIALLDLYAGDTDGAGTVTITTTALGSAASATKGFTVGVSNIKLSISTSLAPNEEVQQNSTVLITATVTEESGALFNVPVQINFSSRCAGSNDATIDSTSFTVNGVATATYKPTSCVDQDIITVEAPASNLIEDIAIDIAATKAQSIRFLNATPEFIALKGTGGAGRQETSEVSFKLVDQNGNPARQQEVTFSLETFPVGTSIDPITAQTNNEGIASTVVESGAVNGVVRVKAQYDVVDDLGNFVKTISSVSDQLTVSTGLPEQSSVSLSFTQSILDGWSFDGNTTEVNIRLGDIFNNDVPDGTAVSFVTEGGRIGSSGQGSCTTTDSTCSITLTTQNPRPEGNRLTDFTSGCAAYSFEPNIAPCINPGGMGQPYGGRVTVTAFAVGEETFFDNKPANGKFDAGETFHDLHEVIYDYNEDGLYQQTEVPKRSHNPDAVLSEADYIAFVNNYKSTTISPVTGEDDNETWHEFDQVDLGDRPSPGNNLYNGTLCSLDDEALGVCTRDFVEVSNSKPIIFADNVYYIRVQKFDTDLPTPAWVDTDEVNLCKPVPITVPPTPECSNGERVVKVRFWVADIHNNPPASGLTALMVTTNGDLAGNNEITTPDTVPSAFGVSPLMIPITVTSETLPNGREEGSLTFSLTARGHTSSASITVIDSF